MKSRNDLLREKILAGNKQFCFIDRELILLKYREEIEALPEKDRFLAAFVHVADEITTPVAAEDILAGRFAEAMWPCPDTPMAATSGILRTEGHITWNWERILQKGLYSFADEVDETARKDPNKYACFFARSTRIFFDAVQRLAARWSEACFVRARQTENPLYRETLNRAGEALKHVPMGPAYDFFSAVQSIWFWQMVTSGICGSRDYTPGRMDQYLLPFYRNDLQKGILTKEEAKDLLAHLFLKFNELSGTATDDFDVKPIPCNSSKQYITLGGSDGNGTCEFNELSALIVEASAECALPQPTLNFRLSTDMPQEVWDLAGKAAMLPSIPNFFNEKIIKNTLRQKGIREDDLHNFDITACNRVNLPGKLYNMMRRIDRFTSPVQWFMEALHTHPKAASPDEILAHFYNIARREISSIAGENVYTDALTFTPDAITVDECREKGLNIRNLSTPRYNWLHVMFSGIATIGDSLNTLEELVFRQCRYTLAEYLKITDANFEGMESLRQELFHTIPHFGNGSESGDRLTVRAAETLLDAVESAAEMTGMIIVPSFYSLSQHFVHGAKLGATPDGRLAGEPVSENMSPCYGRDKSGPTALLRSAASLPLCRTICGGLNFKMGTTPEPEQAAALIKGFFAMGGLHIGISMVNRQLLEEADKNPGNYPSLLVRKFGFSEYFAALSPEFRKEIIQRTEY